MKIRFSKLPTLVALLQLWMWTAASPGASAAGLLRDESENLFSGTKIPHLRIEIPPEGMKTLEAYRQVWGQPRPERIDVRATVRDGARVYTNVAIHLKGSYTFQPVDGKPSFTLNFDKFAPGQRFQGLDKLHLNNSVQDPSYLCERLARELFTQAGVPVARSGHARATLNGRDLGFYVLTEGYNKRFLKRHFASVDGNLYDGGSGGDITKELEVDSGDPKRRDDLQALADAARDPQPAARVARIEKLLDVDRFLSFAAIEVLLLHWDGYCLGPNNFRLFRDTGTGRFVFMPHGLDQILGRGMSPNTSLAPKWDGLMARALFKTPEMRRVYLERARQIYTNQFQLHALQSRVDQMSDQIRRSETLIASERGSFDEAVEELKRRIRQRADAVLQQISRPPQPIAFDASGQLRLTGWQLNRSSRSGASGRRLQVDGRNLLEVSVGGEKWSVGSWRRTLLLGAGRYELTGAGRTVGLPPGTTSTNGIVLRLSGDLEITGITNSTEWVTLHREFEVAGEMEEELVCEFRGPGGAGQFDLSSLRLRRLSQP